MNNLRAVAVATIVLLIGLVSAAAWTLDQPRLDVAAAPETTDPPAEAAAQESTPATEMIVPAPSIENRPDRVTSSAIADFYPIGKIVRSVADLYAQGTGINKSWGLKGEGNFIYQSRFATETEVIGATDDSVTFRQRFVDIQQNLVISEETLELNLADASLLQVAWAQFEPILELHPYYRTVNSILGIGAMLDSNGKRALTQFHKLLRRNGLAIPNDDPLQFQTKIDKLVGMEMEFEYVSGLGVTQVKVLNGIQLNTDELLGLARSAGLFSDYFLSRAKQTPAGQRFNVRSQEIANVLNFGSKIAVTGVLQFRREPFEKSAIETGAGVMLSPIGGEVILRDSSFSQERTGSVKPIAGTVRFSSDDKIIRHARVTWDANLNWVSKDHLLFETEQVRNLTVTSRYNAERVHQKPAE